MATKLTMPGMGLMKGVGIGPLNIGNVLDTMGFVKKAWGAMNAPSAFMPTVDVEELRKRIVDLQAVEQWLVMNLGMIQSSIQVLEVQKATIETLKGVTQGLVPGLGGEASQSSTVSPEAFASTLLNTPNFELSKMSADQDRAHRDAAPGPSTWLDFLQSQFNQVTQAAMSGASLKPIQKPTKSAAKRAGQSAPKKGAAKPGAKKMRSVR